MKRLFTLDLFGLDVPQRISTSVPDILSESFDVTHMIFMYSRAIRVFKDIRQYLDLLFEMKKNFIGVDDDGHIEELKQHTERILADPI